MWCVQCEESTSDREYCCYREPLLSPALSPPLLSHPSTGAAYDVMCLPLIEQPPLLLLISPSPSYSLTAAAEAAGSGGSGSVCEPSAGLVQLQPWASLGIPAELLFLCHRLTRRYWYRPPQYLSSITQGNSPGSPQRNIL